MSSMNFEPKDLIVYRPEMMTRGQKIGGLATFLFFWTMFLYLFRPVFLTIGWLIFGYIFGATASMEEAFWSEVLKPIHFFMLVVIVTMLLLPFWIVIKEDYAADRIRRTKLNLEKIIIPNIFFQTQQAYKLPQEVVEPAQSALKITFYFDHKSNINTLALDDYQVAIENGRARPITLTKANEYEDAV